MRCNACTSVVVKARTVELRDVIRRLADEGAWSVPLKETGRRLAEVYDFEKRKEKRTGVRFGVEIEMFGEPKYAGMWDRG
jgi:hypothetical protein